MVNKAAQKLGRKGGRVKSEKKRIAAIANNKKSMQTRAARYLRENPNLFYFQKEIIQAIRDGKRFFIMGGKRFGVATLASVIQPE